MRAPIRGENLVVVRGADLELAALHAVCTHRGTLLCDGEAGHVDELAFRCPYHGFTYATDGALLEAPGARGEVAGLPRAQVVTHAGVVFVNLDPGAPPLEVPPWLRRAALWTLTRVSRSDNEVRANWKVLIGNFQESHHFPTVHPSLEGKTPWAASSSIIECDAWLGGAMELRDGYQTVSESGQRRGRPFVAAEEDRGRVLDAWVAPLWLTSLQPDYLLTYRLSPLAADRTLVVAEIHVHSGASGDDLDDVLTFWERTNAEDRAICELQQRGLASRSAGASCYTGSEDGLHAFERIVAKSYLEALA